MILAADSVKCSLFSLFFSHIEFSLKTKRNYLKYSTGLIDKSLHKCKSYSSLVLLEKRLDVRRGNVPVSKTKNKLEEQQGWVPI